MSSTSGSLRTCECKHCQRGRAMGRIWSLLPDAEKNELQKIYFDLLDENTWLQDKQLFGAGRGDSEESPIAP